MKKLFVVVLLVSIVVLCGCSARLDFAPVTIPTKVLPDVKVYVCGAVEREGYIIVSASTTVFEAVAQAGLLTQSYLPDAVTDMAYYREIIAVDYFENGQKYSCLNVNGLTYADPKDLSGLDAQVVEAINAHIELFGKITNKLQLKEILGEKYNSNFYKFFVSEADYEAMD